MLYDGTEAGANYYYPVFEKTMFVFKSNKLVVMISIKNAWLIIAQTCYMFVALVWSARDTWLNVGGALVDRSLEN